MATSYKGKYYGPDLFKGDMDLIKAWRKAGKPKDHAKWLKSHRASKPAKPAKPAAPNKGPQAPQQPVAGPDGTLSDPNEWEKEQYKLQAAHEDAMAKLALDEDESNTIADYEQQSASLEAQAAQKRLELKKNRETFNRNKQVAEKDVVTRVNYRGMNRGSAAKRALRRHTTDVANAEADFNTTEGNVEQERATLSGNLLANKTSRLSQIAKRRLALAQRAAGLGIYTQ